MKQISQSHQFLRHLLNFKLDTVNINGIYTSSNSTNKLNPLRNSGKITKIVAGALNPYLLDNGNLGWTNDNCIITTKQEEPQPSRKIS